MSTSAEEQEDPAIPGDGGSSSTRGVDSEIKNDRFDGSHHHQPSGSSGTSLHVSVHREEIASARLQEGSEELQDLDVFAYDRQTYEESVFSQVDKAITDVSSNAAPVQSSSNHQDSSGNIDNLMRLIQNQDGTEENSSQARDEQVLLLARQERLNRVRIKQERIEQDTVSSLSSLPRTPRVSENGLSRNIKSDIPVPSTSGQGGHKLETIETADPLETLPIDVESSGDEYQPECGNEETDDDDDDVSYATDEDVTHDSDASLDESTQRRASEKKIKDDGDFRAYSKRIKSYTKRRAKMRLDNIQEDGTELKKLDEMVKIDGNLQIPKDIWDNLYEHQKTGVRWLWELHQLGTGGILGDEMGLGKTIQMIAFLTALKTSDIISVHNRYMNLGPVVLVCPATVMHQWLQEFRKWYPPFRVAILHGTGSFTGDRKQLVKVIHKSNGILICSYSGVVIYQDYLHALDWHYAILDEGHKIRNPDAQISLACKRFRTPHRIILSGSPVQNNLRELWSIFDFIYPGKLGTLPVFMGQFGIPITQGGYANATDMQVQIAYKCACVLRDTIKPFLLRRTKAEINDKLKLPERSEQVLFCKLTERQRKLYEYYIQSPTVRDIKRGVCQIFVGLIQLRKICNHPDLFDATECANQIRKSQRDNDKKAKQLELFSTDETYGHKEKSGKMMVVDALLKLWKKQKHKVLLFTQSRQMLKIFMKYLDGENLKYLWMDGSTTISTRHSLINSFNSDDEIFIFLLTTRVGGVGVNLIGANRIIIYDPDWNPSTDIQARERAWRIGQTRNVIIYRLLTAGTIEEKIYHRQVFKLYLTNRILRDAKQKRFFKTNDLHELFTLGTDDKNIETKALFDDDMQIDEKSVKKKMSKKDRGSKKSKISSDENSTVPIPAFTEEKLREMRERAKRLSQMIANQFGTQETNNHAQCTPETPFDIDVGVDQNGSKADKGQVESDKQPLDDNSDTCQSFESVPYCPSWGTITSTGTESSSATSKKDQVSSKKRVHYLVKQSVYKPPKDPKDDYKHDDYILGRLFKNSNISGALKHDRIEGDCTADYKVVESEAEKVARDAIRVLRESRRHCLTSTSGIPNWTGRNGQVASQARLLPRNRARAQQVIGNRSNLANEDSLLSSIRKRNQVNPVPLRTGQEDPLASDDDETDRDFVGRATDTGADRMAKKVRDYVLYQAAVSGEAQTDELLDFFKKNFDPKETAVFKAILYKICELQRRGDKGFWRLKTEFRDL
jgi:DNA excision repair protein ERCC-6